MVSNTFLASKIIARRCSIAKPFDTVIVLPLGIHLNKMKKHLWRSFKVMYKDS